MERRAEVIMTSSLPVKSSCTTVHQSLKVLWLLPTTSYWGKHLHCLHSFHHRRLLLWKNSQLQLLSPTPAPKQSARPKRWHPSSDPVESMPMGGTTPKAILGGPPQPCTSIHEIQASWTGPKELKQANYALQYLPKGLKFLHACCTPLRIS